MTSSGASSVSGDVIVENADEGNDTVETTITYTLADKPNLENLTLLEAGGAIDGTGNDANNIIRGNSYANSISGGGGNDSLVGGAGTDTISGGTGNDTFVVEDSSDVLIENSGEGTDLVQSSVTWTFNLTGREYFENLTLTGTSAIDGTGNAQANLITGNDMANVLSGLDGNDTLYGNDGADSLSGGNDNDSLYGGDGNDTLNGGSGNDYLDGEDDFDLMIGGTGNDTFVLGSTSDVAVENSGEGTDLIVSYFDLSLNTTSGSYVGANFENLDLVGNAADSGTGNANANYIRGLSNENYLLQGLGGNDTLTTSNGNDTLDGGTGVDSMMGGLGSDTYYVDDSNDVIVEVPSTGSDLVISTASYVLSDYLARLTLDEAGGAINGTGNAWDNILNGNSYNQSLIGGDGNDEFYGNGGSDTLMGGAGDDTYYDVNPDDDTVIDTEGHNVIYFVGGGSSGGGGTPPSMPPGLPGDGYLPPGPTPGTPGGNLTGNDLDNKLVGNDGNNVLSGLGGNDTLIGNDGADTLYGGNGNDLLDGGAGIDTMDGGSGNDHFVVDNTSDSLVDSSGTDTVETSVGWTLGTDYENYILTGSGNFLATANELDNLIVEQNTGNTTIDGSFGNDTYQFVGDWGVDRLSDLTGIDWLDFSDAGVAVGGGGITVRLDNNRVTGQNGSSLTWRGDIFENVVGSGGNDRIIGNTLDNILDGGAGNDYIDAGAGDDYLVGSLGEDTLFGGSGNDTYVYGAEFGPGSITDVQGVDTLDLNGYNQPVWVGMNGFIAGPTTISWNANDFWVEKIITDAADTFSLAELTTAVEVISNQDNDSIFTGSGNDTIDAGSENDTVSAGAGNDSITGGSGTDSLLGGFGNDTYMIDNTSDVIVENASEGMDSVLASASYTLSSNVEILTLSGSSNINGTGSSDDNTITGNSGNNILDGATGNDTFIFLNSFGNDTLSDASGTDTIDLSALTSAATVNLTSGAGDELSVGTNKANWASDIIESVIGTAQADSITGSSGANRITGGAGNDTVVGGAGNDTYVFANGYGSDSLNDSGGSNTADFSALTTNLNFNNAWLGTAVSSGSTVTWSLGTDLSTVYGGSGNDTIISSSAAELIYANGGNDSIDSNGGNDTVYGGDGNDSLGAGTGNDYIDGGNGDDLFYESFNFPSGTDTYIGGIGTDTLDISNYGTTSNLEFSSTGTTLTKSSFTGYLSGIEAVKVSSSATFDVIDGRNATAGFTANLATETLSSVDTAVTQIQNFGYVYGSAYGDTITGNSAANGLNGYAGDDTIKGGAGSDQIDGGTGNNTYLVSEGDGSDQFWQYDASTVTNVMQFDSSVSQSVVAVYQLGNGNLQIGFTDSSGDLITITAQNLSNYQVDRFELSNGNFMTASDINNVISSMASYASAHSISFTSLDDVKNDSNLMSIVNSGWHT